jgi:DNA polymerase-1
LSRLHEADILVCHNEIEYDLPLFKKVYGWEPKPHQIVLDTLVFSRMMHPKRAVPYGMKSKAPHSIEAWARRFDKFKVENEDWSVYTDHMGVRCKSDVEINKLVLKELINEAGYQGSEDVFFQSYAGR